MARVKKSQVMRRVRKAHKLIEGGSGIGDACKAAGVSAPTFAKYRTAVASKPRAAVSASSSSDVLSFISRVLENQLTQADKAKIITEAIKGS